MIKKNSKLFCFREKYKQRVGSLCFSLIELLNIFMYTLLEEGERIIKWNNNIPNVYRIKRLEPKTFHILIIILFVKGLFMHACVAENW